LRRKNTPPPYAKTPRSALGDFAVVGAVITAGEGDHPAANDDDEQHVDNEESKEN
jgi:hypothetical protein